MVYIRRWSLKRAFSFVWPKRNNSVQNKRTRVDVVAIQPQNYVFCNKKNMKLLRTKQSSQVHNLQNISIFFNKKWNYCEPTQHNHDRFIILRKIEIKKPYSQELNGIWICWVDELDMTTIRLSIVLLLGIILHNI